MINLRTNLNIISGNKKIYLLKKLTKDLGFKYPFLIIDKNLNNQNKYLSNFLKISKFSNLDYYDYKFEPSYELLEKKIEEYKKKKLQKKIDVIIAIGGGSTIDFAKGIALLLNNLNKKPILLKGFPLKYNLPIPVVAIPSTCGTGSEVAFNASFIHEKSKTKLGINVKENFPILSILDPNLIRNSPKRVMYSSLSDTLVHIIEGFISSKSNHISRYFSKISFDLFKENIKGILVNKPSNSNLQNLQWASSFAMMGMSNSSHGISGALSYFLGTHYGINHGIAGGFFLKKICYLNNKKGYNDLSLLSNSMNKSKNIRNKEILNFIFEVLELFLSEFEIENLDKKLKNDIHFKNYLSNINSTFSLNPVKVTYKNIMDLF